MNPSIKLEIDPHRMVSLATGKGVRAGGVRVKTTIYIVEEPDIPGATTSTITTVTVPRNEKIGIAVVREDETLEEMKVGIIG